MTSHFGMRVTPTGIIRSHDAGRICPECGADVRVQVDFDDAWFYCTKCEWGSDRAPPRKEVRA